MGGEKEQRMSGMRELFFKEDRDFFPAASRVTGTAADAGKRGDLIKTFGPVCNCLEDCMELDAFADASGFQAGQNLFFAEHVALGLSVRRIGYDGFSKSDRLLVSKVVVDGYCQLRAYARDRRELFDFSTANSIDTPELFQQAFFSVRTNTRDLIEG